MPLLTAEVPFGFPEMWSDMDWAETDPFWLQINQSVNLFIECFVLEKRENYPSQSLPEQRVTSLNVSFRLNNSPNPDPEQQILALKTLQQEFLIKTLDQSSHRAGILLSVDQGVSELHITSLTSRSMPPEANTVI